MLPPRLIKRVDGANFLFNEFGFSDAIGNFSDNLSLQLLSDLKITLTRPNVMISPYIPYYLV